MMTDKGFEKIPKTAVCVYRGVLHDVYQWKQEMFDGTERTFEAIRRNPSVTIIAVTNEQEIVAISEEQPRHGAYTTLPGGIAERDDLLAEAQRELLEETGYASGDWELWTSIDVVNYSKLEWKSYFFIARGCRKIADPSTDPGEKIAVSTMNFDEFVGYAQQPDFAIDFIKSAIANEAVYSQLKKLVSK